MTSSSEPDLTTITQWEQSITDVTSFIANHVMDENTSTWPHRRVILLPLVLMILLTGSANVVVMLCTRLDAKLKKAHSNLYVFSLAIPDLLMALLVMPAMSIYTYFGWWPLGDTLCTLWISLDALLCTVSMLHLCLISHDRHMALSQPLTYKSPNKRRQALVCIGLAWIGSTLAWVPAILYFRLTMEPAPNDCYYIPEPLYIPIQASLVFYPPICIMCYYYITCVHGLRVHFRKVQAMTRRLGGGRRPAGSTGNSTMAVVSVITSTRLEEPMTSSVLTDTTATTETGIGASEKTQGAATKVNTALRRRQEHLRSIRTLGVIIVIFLFCWLPFCIFWPIAAYCDTCIPAEWYQYSYWAACLNSFFNPYIYFISNKEFRRALWTIIKGN